VKRPEPYQPFPVDQLPPPWNDFVSEQAKALGCDPAYVGLAVIATAAGAIGNTRTIRLKHGWEEPATVWAGIVGDSGTIKSPAWSKAVAPLFGVQKKHLDDFQQEMERYESELAVWERDRKQDPAAPKPVKPVLKRVV